MNDLKVLVVDDESRMRKLVRDFLVKDGYSVVEAADGEEAVDVFMVGQGHLIDYSGCYDAEAGWIWCCGGSTENVRCADYHADGKK